MGGGVDRLPREFFERDSRAVAVDLLGRVVTHAGVSVRLTEVEAYLGAGDPGSHTYRGMTRRNATMFGPPGHLYTYFTYGMHWCANLVCEAPGTGTAVLLRAGQVLDGVATARARRPAARRDVDLCRGPARLASALGLAAGQDGLDACAGGALQVLAGSPPPAAAVRSGPRVGLTRGVEHEWRYWIDGDPTVSAFRAGVARRRKPASADP